MRKYLSLLLGIIFSLKPFVGSEFRALSNIEPSANYDEKQDYSTSGPEGCRCSCSGGCTPDCVGIVPQSTGYDGDLRGSGFMQGKT